VAHVDPEPLEHDLAATARVRGAGLRRVVALVATAGLLIAGGPAVAIAQPEGGLLYPRVVLDP